jgi:hypothetical protein
MKNEQDLKQYCVPIFIEENKLAFWDYEITKKNLEFINQIDPDYFEYVTQLNFNILNGEGTDNKTKQHAAISLRSAYSQGLEVLFSLMFATIQAPDCVIGWILKYSNTELENVIEKFVKGENITTNYIDSIKNWTDVSNLVFSYLNNEQSIIFRSKIQGFAQLWSNLAKDFLEPLNKSEYNSIKHGLRIKMGGHHFLFGQHEHMDESVENQQWLTVSNSEFGTTFFTSERIEKTPNFIVLEHKRNWNPEKYFHVLLLISISIKNILVCLNNMNGNQNNSNYLFPNDENFYETPWKFDDSAHLSVRPRIANKNLPILTKEGISSAYKKDVDLN